MIERKMALGKKLLNTLFYFNSWNKNKEKSTFLPSTECIIKDIQGKAVKTQTNLETKLLSR